MQQEHNKRCRACEIGEASFNTLHAMNRLSINGRICSLLDPFWYHKSLVSVWSIHTAVSIAQTVIKDTVGLSVRLWVSLMSQLDESIAAAVISHNGGRGAHVMPFQNACSYDQSAEVTRGYKKYTQSLNDDQDDQRQTKCVFNGNTSLHQQALLDGCHCCYPFTGQGD